MKFYRTRFLTIVFVAWFKTIILFLLQMTRVTYFHFGPHFMLEMSSVLVMKIRRCKPLEFSGFLRHESPIL